jgi:hypothetical protein
MFQSSLSRMRALLSRADEQTSELPAVPAPHPHRVPLRIERTRRAGSVPARPAHCISPVRASRESQSRDAASH